MMQTRQKTFLSIPKDAKGLCVIKTDLIITLTIYYHFQIKKEIVLNFTAVLVV